MLFNLCAYKDSTAVISDRGERYSYGELNAMQQNLSVLLKQGRLAFCLCNNTVGSLVGYLSFIQNHVPAVMLDGEKDIEIINGLIDIYQPQYLWIPENRDSEFEGKTLIKQDGYLLIERKTIQYEIHPAIALLLTTSGSTGSPKLVKLTLQNLQSNADSIVQYLDITSEERPITSLPMYYSYGLSVINSHLVKGATILLTDKTVIQKEFWTFAKEMEATSIAGVPYTYEMLRRLRIFRMDLPSLKTMTQAGGKLNAKIAEEYIRNAEETGRRFFVMYGQTEATARMSYLPQERAIEKYDSIGIAIPGGSFSLIDGDGGDITEPDVDGELIYKGSNVSMGYAECIADLSKGDENNGVLHTGDIGHRDVDGYYYITGRMKRFVKIWGNRCNLDAIEQLVKTITVNCACVGVDDLITVFVIEPGLDTEIKNFLSEKTGLNIRAFTVKVINAIPKSPTGKLLYSELQKLIN